MNTLYTFFTGIALLFSNLFGGNHTNQQPVISPSEVSLLANENLKSTSTEIAPGDAKVMIDAQDLIIPKFRVLKLYDNEGKKVVLSSEDSSIVDVVITLIKDDKNVGYHLNDLYQIILSSEIAFISISRPIGGSVQDDFILDIKNKKILSKFTVRSYSVIDENSFVTIDDKNGLSYYAYGASSLVKIPNSVLIGNETYTAFEGPEGSIGFKLVATTTKSFTFDIFDKTAHIVKPGDDTTYYKKVEERTFMIP